MKQTFLDFLIHFYGLPRYRPMNYRSALVFVIALSFINVSGHRKLTYGLSPN